MDESRSRRRCRWRMKSVASSDAYRVRQLQLASPGFAEDSQARWEHDPLWQPLRKVIELLLVVYDWGESFVALNLVLKPILTSSS